MNFKDKVVVITGGSTGIGLCIVKHLLATDIKIINLFELETPNSIEIFRALQKQHGNRIDYYSCDVAKTSQLEDCFERVFKRFKTVDILINNMFIVNENEPERMIDVNYKAVVMATLKMTELVGKHKSGNGGVIVNIVSIVGLKNYVLPIYSSTRHAVISFTRTMMQHFDVTGVRVIAICPGVTKMPILDEVPNGLDFITTGGIVDSLGPMQSPENVARALVNIIGEGKTGDVWVAEEDQPAYVVKAIEDYKSLRLN